MGETNKELIGDYELIALIGDGAQGRVYKARCVADALPHVKKDEEVALKVVRVTGEDEKLRLKFQEQAEILRRLSHTSIVSYRDCFAWHTGEWDEAQCLVMELLEGETLSDRLKNANTGLPWPQVEEVFEQCLAGLIHARERGITHRDLKPSNIFITKDGKAKLIDFDIARRDDSGQMSTAGWKGTFDYMAPDFITVNGFRGDELSDIFSLGVCFYQALTGSLPYEALGETAHIGYLNRWRDQAAPAPSFRPGVFRVLSNAKALVSKSLAARREQRFATFSAMLEEFRKIRYRRIRHKNKDEYELLAVLGRGGFGEVFKARRMSDGMLVAVKYLFSEKQSDRFIKEAKILQQYPHPNLVKYVDFMVLDGTAGEKQFFLVMEFLEGMPGWTLRPRLKHEGRLEVTEAIPLFCGYLSALQFLHGSARPIIHRDIKPGNLYAPVGQPEKGKVFDLGVARDVSGTVTVGGVPGTLDYMPPEFADTGGDRGSPQSDLYALGLCLYEALSGKPVFERLPTDLNSAWLAFQDRIRKPPPVAFDAAVFVQFPRLKPVILKVLAEKPEGRYRSAADMRVALEEALKPEAGGLTHDEGFESGEVTMATFSGGSGAEDHCVTQGTRPLEATAAAPGGLIAAGKREAARRKTHKAVMIVGGAVAALLIFGLGGVWLGSNFQSRDIGVKPAAREAGANKGVTRTPNAERRTPNSEVTDKPVEPVRATETEKAEAEAKVKAEAEAERIASEKAAKLEAERLAAAKAEAEIAAKAEADRVAAVKAEADKLAAAKAEADKLAAAKAEVDKLAAAKAEANRLAAVKAEEDVKAAKAAADKLAAAKLEAERLVAAKAEEDVKAAKAAADKLAAAKLEADRLAAAMSAADKPATNQGVAGTPNAERRTPNAEVADKGVAGTPTSDLRPPTSEVTDKAAATVPADLGTAVLEITVNPKTAAVSVDGKPVSPGRVEVTPNENHKVTVTCAGYKTVQQSYIVRPGAPRKIDILLEKEIRKSFFGL